MQTKILPYVYRLDNPITGEFYIGYREANTEPAHIDLPKYRTSAPKVKESFAQFEWYIVAEFFDGDSAYDFEQLCIHENWNNPLLLNQYNNFGKARFRYKLGSRKGWKLSKPRKPMSDDQKLKIKNALTGRPKSESHKESLRINHADYTKENNPFFGKTHSESTLEKLRNVDYTSRSGDNHHMKRPELSPKGKSWYNDGIKTYFVFNTNPIINDLNLMKGRSIK